RIEEFLKLFNKILEEFSEEELDDIRDRLSILLSVHVVGNNPKKNIVKKASSEYDNFFGRII
ncbi:hypothetical protein ALC60_00727, partial [Trachymyrmex zeteki]